LWSYLDLKALQIFSVVLLVCNFWVAYYSITSQMAWPLGVLSCYMAQLVAGLELCFSLRMSFLRRSAFSHTLIVFMHILIL
jgi:hypothetical protein